MSLMPFFSSEPARHGLNRLPVLISASFYLLATLKGLVIFLVIIFSILLSQFLFQAIVILISSACRVSHLASQLSSDACDR